MKPTTITSITITTILVIASINTASAQLSTACTSSLISSFTPCLNFLTGSTNGGGSPTQGCCASLSSLISSSTDCACLILTGGVPVSLPINRQLAITLPKLCNSQAVPIKCKASASTLPSPGPVAHAPSLPPLPPFSSVSNTEPPAESPSSTADEPVSPPSNQGQRPILIPSSAIKNSYVMSPSLLFLVLLLCAVLRK